MVRGRKDERNIGKSKDKNRVESATLLTRVGNSPCQGTDVFTPDPGVCQPPFTSYPPPPPFQRERGR